MKPTSRPAAPQLDAETLRLEENDQRRRYWTRWGPYLSERQWGTVREDYSAHANPWENFPHDHARSRAYRWGEDGLLGICDTKCRLAFALALWNGHDPILKERLYGLTGPEGNHGEDVKECYFYLDATPTHSYLKALYKYPQRAFPYAQLAGENARRGPRDPEFELLDTGVFEGGRYFDVFAEYAKASPEDILIRLTIENRGPDTASLRLLPTLWFRNTWSWGREGEDYPPQPRLFAVQNQRAIQTEHATLGQHRLEAEGIENSPEPCLLFTGNETNFRRLFNTPNPSPFVKDAFHDYVVHGQKKAVNPEPAGTKAAFDFTLDLPPGGRRVVRLRLYRADAPPERSFGLDFDELFARRLSEADAFYAARMPAEVSGDERGVMRQAYAGLIWSKQFYHYVVKDWREGDPAFPAPPPERAERRNRGWDHLFNRDILSMPDKWEFPWFAAWDTAFHMLPMARIDPDFARRQLILFLREWYLHPNGQIPAYEFAFEDVNPPVHAWAAWHVHQLADRHGEGDCASLERIFHKLLLNFTWWVNRKDLHGKNIFAGGFLGLDNIGVFDRSALPFPDGRVEQADATAWMAFYCLRLLEIALKLACRNPAYEDIASKFFEHFVAISDAINSIGGTGLWHEEDGFYYDLLHLGPHSQPLRVRSLVGLIPLIAVDVLDQKTLDRLPHFTRRMEWLIHNRPDLARHISCCESCPEGDQPPRRLLAIPSQPRLERLLRVLLDEEEFLSPFGVRSLSRRHGDQPCVVQLNGREYKVGYEPGESECGMFGGNSNWRGPVWFPLNYLLIEALQRYHTFHGDRLRVECPTGSGRLFTLDQVARELAARLTRLFLRDPSGHRPWHGPHPIFATDPHWQDLQLFHEYFHGETGQGLGASHQTGWTSLVTCCFEIARGDPPSHDQARRES
jgi:hypothetical protein